MSSSIALNPVITVPGVTRLPALPWRDPHAVSPEELSGYIAVLEKACLDNPESADLRVALGMAYAMDYNVYDSMDALELATKLEPEHFWAQMKYAELQYRMRSLAVAEDETLKAVDLAGNPWELSVARKQLQEIRRMRREGARDVTWSKPLAAPALFLAGMMALIFVVMLWK